MEKHALKIGVNLGGWISQYDKFDHNHFDTFITKDDFSKIADWGFDHIRLPIDYPILEDDSKPGEYLESGFAYLDRSLEWAKDNGLRLIFDIHKAPGYSFTNTMEAVRTESNTLFSNPSSQRRFVELWGAVTKRYQNQYEDNLAFELLNEIVLPDSLPWNNLASQTLAHLRTLDPHRLIILGGNNYNAVDELKNIRLLPDDKILYTFHFYEPMVVTHQKAHWLVEMVHFDKEVSYPGEVPELEQFLAEHHPTEIPRYQKAFGRRLDKQLLVEFLKPAKEFIQQHGGPLYCGEFGVIDRAPAQTRINWTRDFIGILNECQIGYSYWCYKQKDFGLVDQNGDIEDSDLLRIISQTGS